MPSPFPGMDPFLEHPAVFPGVHDSFITYLRESLQAALPAPYFAEPRAQLGRFAEIDIATFHENPTAANGHSLPSAPADGGVVTWAPPQPTLAVATDLPTPDEFGVRVYDDARQARLVAAIEIVSPANKDRPDHRRAFVAKWAALLQNHVSVTVIDLVTTREFNLYADLLALIGVADPAPAATSQLYAAACRTTPRDGEWRLETWSQPLAVGGPLPTLPVWLADDLAVPLELEASYEETCRVLRLP